MTKVSVGITSIIGWVSGFLLAAPPILNQIVAIIENNQVQLTGSEKLMAILGVISAGTTAIGRYAQAHKKIGMSDESIGIEVPPTGPATSIGEPPESARTPDAVPESAV